jgi:hypothetical protein
MLSFFGDEDNFYSDIFLLFSLDVHKYEGFI